MPVLIARARQPYIATSPEVGTPLISSPPPPNRIVSTIDLRAYGLIGAGGSTYIHANPPVAPNTFAPGPNLVAREYPALPHPGSSFLTVSHQLPSVNGRRLFSSQLSFTPDVGSSITRRGGIDSLPPNYPRPLIAVETARPYPLGSTFITHGGPNPVTAIPPRIVATVSSEYFRQPYPGSTFTTHGGQPPIIPPPPALPFGIPPLIAREIPAPPYPGSATFRIGSGDLNPTRPQHIIIARESDIVSLPTLLPGSTRIAAQHTDTIIQTATRVFSSQSYVPLYPGSTFTAHAPIDNGSHRLTPLIVQESPRPFPAGSVYYESGAPDNGIRYQNPLIASLSSADVMLLLSSRNLAGMVLGIVGSPLPPIPPIPPAPPVPSPAEICAFSADLTDTEAFTYDFIC